jgi:hypothetical protein
MTEDHSPKPAPPIRARRWSRPPSSSPRRRSGFGLRLIAIPIIAVAGVLIFRGLRDHFVLPECDSERARHTLAEVLTEMKLEPVRYEPIKTVSSGKDKMVCNAVLPLPDGGTVVADYTFYWEGNKANMRYSIARRPPNGS